jgi:hypothetical protein
MRFFRDQTDEDPKKFPDFADIVATVREPWSDQLTRTSPVAPGDVTRDGRKVVSMKNIITSSLLLATLVTVATATTAHAQPACDPCAQSTQPAQPAAPAALPPPTLTTAGPSAQPSTFAAPPMVVDEDSGWHRPAGERFTSGFRMGWMYLANFDAKNRTGDNGQMTSLKDQYGLKNPNMFLIGYEGFYRILGHSWLNVLMVGNVSVAGLDQSKFIPTGSGLLGFEINRSFELGVGVNLIPDTQSPSHMIVAAGWTPKVGSIQTPIHFFYIPDSAGTNAMGDSLKGNSRMGATVGMNW